MFINCGAYVNGRRPNSKKALKEALLANPGSVTFDETSLFASERAAPLTGKTIPAGAKLQVTGPDPYTSRKFYATVEIVGGKVKVS